MKKAFVGLLAIGVLVGGYVAYRVMWSETLTNVTFVKDGERVCSSDSDCKFLEYSTDETFENTDEWSFMKFNSSDVHRMIRKDLTCDSMLVSGIRIPFMSWYRNIIKVENCK